MTTDPKSRDRARAAEASAPAMTLSQQAACLFAKTQADAAGRDQREVNQIVRGTIEAIQAPTPVRLQLSRRKGFDLQALSQATNGLPAVNVARPTKWGNPFTVKGCREAGFQGNDTAIARRCVEAFRVWIDTPHWRENWGGEESATRRGKAREVLPYLRGKNLACWCSLDQPCHADVLLEIANRPICEAV